jgi:hypothetical protein
VIIAAPAKEGTAAVHAESRNSESKVAQSAMKILKAERLTGHSAASAQQNKVVRGIKLRGRSVAAAATTSAAAAASTIQPYQNIGGLLQLAAARNRRCPAPDDR